MIELPEEQYLSFCREPWVPHSFLEEHQEDITVKDGIWQCLLVLGEGQQDGILVNTDTVNMSVYVSYLPWARKLYLLDQYPALSAFNEIMGNLAEYYVQKAIEGQQNGLYRILKYDLLGALEAGASKFELMLKMLKERQEFSYLEYSDEELFIKLNQKYVQEDTELPVLSQREADIKCARHLLWILGTEEGRRAVFAGYDLSGLDLSHRNLNQAVFTGSRMTETSLEETEVCFAEFSNVQMINCNLKGITAEEAEFQNVFMDHCDCKGAYFTHSDFANARIMDSCLDHSKWQNCYGDRIVFRNTSTEQAVMPKIFRLQCGEGAEKPIAAIHLHTKEDDVYFTSESCDSIYTIASFYENELKRDAGEMTLDSLAAAFGETQFLSAQIFSALGRAMLVDEHITLMKFDFDEKKVRINQQKDMQWHSYYLEDVGEAVRKAEKEPGLSIEAREKVFEEVLREKEQVLNEAGHPEMSLQ